MSIQIMERVKALTARVAALEAKPTLTAEDVRALVKAEAEAFALMMKRDAPGIFADSFAVDPSAREMLEAQRSLAGGTLRSRGKRTQAED